MAGPQNVKKDAKSLKGQAKVVAKSVEKSAEKLAAAFGNSYETARLVRAEQGAVKVGRPAYANVGQPKPQIKRRWWWPFGGAVESEAAQSKADIYANIQEVRAGVLQNMETLSQQSGPRVQGKPFSNIMLPQPRRVSFLGRLWGGIGSFFGRFWRWFVVLAMVVLAVVWWQGRELSPAQVLGRAVVAVRSGDVAAVQRLVDVPAVAGSVVNQVFAMPNSELVKLPADLAEMVRREGALVDFDNFVKPGLAEALGDDALASVEQGEVVRGGLLAKLWEALGGEQLRVQPAKVAMEDARLMVMELPLRREDLNVTLPLQVVLDRGAAGEGAWQVADVPNFAATLAQMGELVAKREAAGRAGMMVEVLEPLGEPDVEPAAGPSLVAQAVGKRAVMGGIELTLRVKNTGSRTLRDVPLWVGMGDAAGRCLTKFAVILPGELPVGATRVQRWRVPVAASGRAKFVRVLPLEAMRVDVWAAK